MATFEEKAEQLKKELEEAANDDRRCWRSCCGNIPAAKAIRKSFGKKYYLPLYKYPILIDFGTPDGQICVVHPSNFVCYTAPFLRRISAAFSYSVVPAVYKETTAGRESFRRWK